MSAVVNRSPTRNELLLSTRSSASGASRSSSFSSFTFTCGTPLNRIDRGRGEIHPLLVITPFGGLQWGSQPLVEVEVGEVRADRAGFEKHVSIDLGHGDASHRIEFQVGGALEFFLVAIKP